MGSNAFLLLGVSPSLKKKISKNKKGKNPLQRSDLKRFHGNGNFQGREDQKITGTGEGGS
jgi:hypothetical protein